MSGWPVIPPPGDDEDRPPGVTRIANVLIPFTLLDTGRTIKVHVAMPEADARAMVNMHPDQARSMGPFFESVRNYLTEFLMMEG